MSQSNHDSEWKNANSRCKRRFRGRRCRGILNSLLSDNSDAASVETFSRLYQIIQLRESREIRFALPFPFSNQLNIWSFYVVVVQERKKKLQEKHDARAELTWLFRS